MTFKSNRKYTNLELKRALTGFPRSLTFRMGWSLKGIPIQVRVAYKDSFVANPLLVYGDFGKLSEEEILKRTVSALYKYMKHDPDAFERFNSAFFYAAHNMADGTREEYEMPARIYMENYMQWFEEWEKNGRKVNVE